MRSAQEQLIKDGYMREIPRRKLPGAGPRPELDISKSWQLEMYDRGQRFYEFVPVPSETAVNNQTTQQIGHAAVAKITEPKLDLVA